MNNPVKISLTLLLFLILGTSLVLSGAQIVEFFARRTETAVILEWSTDYESNIRQFNIERCNDQQSWIHIGTTSARGESTTREHYSYTDNTIFKTEQTNFYYRLVIVENTGQKVPHDVIASIHGNSGIRHTWGSIKAIFR